MCSNCNIPIDVDRSEAFAERLLEIMNHGALTLMISVGHRTGLFDTMSKLAPSTSVEIAEAAGLNERYVREWLGAMTVGRFVEYDPVGSKYSLPAEHAAFLTRAAGADNVAVFAQYIAVLGSVEDRIVECFENGGGVSYREFKRFHEVMAEDSGQSVAPALLEHILPLVPGVIERLRTGIDVLDIGCGRGRTLTMLAETFPNSRFTGFDLSKEAIAYAREEASKRGLSNIQFMQKDLTGFDENGHADSFDFITAFDAIHDQARPDKVLNGIHRALRKGGSFLMQDIDGSSEVSNNMERPLGPLLYTISTFHCMTVSLAQGGFGLGTMWGIEKAEDMLAEAGFGDVSIHRLEHDIQNCYYVLNKS